jgi:RNase P/RNase MRP subunit POP5
MQIFQCEYLSSHSQLETVIQVQDLILMYYFCREFRDVKPLEMNARMFKLLLMSAVKTLHGDHGSAATMDVLRFDSEEKRGYLRISSNHFVMVSTALSMVSAWQEKSCAIRIHKVCHSLSSLPIESVHQRHTTV